MIHLRISLLVALVVLVFSSGCRTPKPTSLAQWSACWHQGHTIEFRKPRVKGVKLDQVRLNPNKTTAVLHLATRWGQSLFVSEYTFAFLMLELPATVKTGQTVKWTSSGRGIYREGGQMVSLETRKFSGKLTVLKRDKSRIRVRLEMMTGPAKLNLLKSKPRVLKGDVTLMVINSRGAC